VADDGRIITAYFLGKAPDHLDRDQVHISAPPSGRPVELERDPEIHRHPEPDVDDCVEIRLLAPGGRGAYMLCVSGAELDPRLSCLGLRFDLGCPDDLDCVPTVACSEPAEPELDLDYLAKDYDSFRRVLLERLSLVMPEWTERHVPDVGVALVELLAYVGDQLSYQQDAVATEAYLRTARHRISVRRHARLVDYTLHEGCNARVLVCLGTDADQTLDLTDLQFLAEVDPKRLTADEGDAQVLAVVFEPIADSETAIHLRRAHNTIAFHTWGDRQCCLPTGATEATLVDAWTDAPKDDAEGRARALDLRVGDLVVLEEVKGPHTGDAADADMSHRHPVRLTSVESDVDWLVDPPDGLPVVRVTWDIDDALPFPLCLSSLDDDCALVADVSVARGNVVLADHGRTVTEPLGEVGTAEQRQTCCGEGRPAERRDEPFPFRPAPLRHGPVTYRKPPGEPRPAARLLAQDPHAATPSVDLRQRGPQLPETGVGWIVRPDLLSSSPYDRDFVVEVDDEQRARLRFGDGRNGRRPEARTSFTATYRIGNGPAGNVGAEAVTAAVRRTATGHGDPIPATVRNPLPAVGGTPPEALAAAKDLAPVTFRSTLQRAVTADDYAVLGARDDVSGGAVQRCSTVLRWTGSWYEALTTVDARGDQSASHELLTKVAAGLERYRRIGHDLVVAPAAYVPLLVELSVCVLPGFQRAHVRAALLEALSNRRLGPGRLGYFHPDNLGFGDAVTVSGLTSAAQAVPGVESVDVTRLERLWEGDHGEVAGGALRLAPDEVARLDNDPARPQNGTLVLSLGGGR
jgi:hypothetical protein